MDTDDWWYTNSKKVDVTLATSAPNPSSPLSIHVPIHPMMGTNNDVLCSSIRPPDCWLTYRRGVGMGSGCKNNRRIHIQRSGIEHGGAHQNIFLLQSVVDVGIFRINNHETAFPVTQFSGFSTPQLPPIWFDTPKGFSCTIR